MRYRVEYSGRCVLQPERLMRRREAAKGAVVALLAALTLACHHAPPDGPAPARAIVGVEWQLIELNGRMTPPAADWHLATLLLAPDSSLASGYAGCNQFTATYTLAWAKLSFGPLALTQMACEQGLALEEEYTKALAATTSQQMNDGILELLAGTDTVARFKR